jgi:hypothetical protein
MFPAFHFFPRVIESRDVDVLPEAFLLYLGNMRVGRSKLTTANIGGAFFARSHRTPQPGKTLMALLPLRG